MIGTLIAPSPSPTTSSDPTDTPGNATGVPPEAPIVTTPGDWPIVAPDGEDKLTANRRAGALAGLSRTGTATSSTVSPGGKLKVPDTAV
jgi:hypothetical protein